MLKIEVILGFAFVKKSFPHFKFLFATTERFPKANHALAE